MSSKKVSYKWGIIKEDLKKIGIGALIALAGALATWLESSLLDLIDFSKFGEFASLAATIVAALNSIAINFLRKLASINEY